MKSLNSLNIIMILVALQLGLTACGPGLETSGNNNPNSLNELQYDLEKAENSLLSTASEDTSGEAEERTDEEIIADFRARLEDLFANIEARVERLEQDGVEIPERLLDWRESVLAQIEATLLRLEEDQEFRDKIIEGVRRAATLERPEPNREKLCEHLSRILSGDLSNFPEGARTHLQKHYEEVCTVTEVIQ